MVGGDPAEAFNNFNGFNSTDTGIRTGGTATLNVNASSAHVTAQTLYVGTMARLPAAATTTVNIGSASPDASPIVELTGTVFPAYGIGRECRESRRQIIRDYDGHQPKSNRTS